MNPIRAGASSQSLRRPKKRCQRELFQREGEEKGVNFLQREKKGKKTITSYYKGKKGKKLLEKVKNGAARESLLF